MINNILANRFNLDLKILHYETLKNFELDFFLLNKIVFVSFSTGDFSLLLLNDYIFFKYVQKVERTIFHIGLRNNNIRKTS